MIVSAEEKKFQTFMNQLGGVGEMSSVEFCPSQGLPAHNKMLAEVTINPGASLGTHVHEGNAEIYFITEGEGILDDNGTERPVKKGDLMICYNGEFHGMKNPSDQPLKFFACIINQ